MTGILQSTVDGRRVRWCTCPAAVLVGCGGSPFGTRLGGFERKASVRAPWNPLRGLAFDADALARHTTNLDGPLVLVGHSYGGAVISQAAPAVRDVRGLVFLSAFAPGEGESCATVQEGFPASLHATANVASAYDAPGAAGGPDLYISIDRFHETFCADLPESIAAPIAVSQRPLSAAALTEPATAAGWTSLPSWYLVSERDNAIPPDCERFMPSAPARSPSPSTGRTLRSSPIRASPWASS